MRTKIVLKNFMVAWVGQMLVLVCNFVARTIFVRELGVEYLGVGGLFQNVLTLLSLSEFGIGTAIIFRLYAPIAENDIGSIQSLMATYKKIYYCIGGFVLLAGAAVTPLVPYFAKDGIHIPHIYLIYLLFVFNTGLSYFFVHKRSLIIAVQQKYVVDLYHNGFKILQLVLTSAVLIWTQNYIFYLVLQIAVTLAENVAIQCKADRMFPYLREKSVMPLDEGQKAAIRKDAGSMAVHRSAEVVVKGTDNLILSRFVGMTAVGIYANYFLISNVIQGGMTMVFESMTASVGNFGASEERSRQRKLFSTLSFMEFWIVSFCSISLMCLWNPFITLWIGEGYVFDQWIVLMLSICFYLSGRRQVVLMFRDALGLYKYDYWKAILEMVVNLVLSIFLAMRLGTIGVFAGTAISMLCVCLPVEPNILYRYGFYGASRKYYRDYLLEMIFTVLVGWLTWNVTNLLGDGGIVRFLEKMILCALLPNVFFWLCCHRMEAYIALVDYIRPLLPRKNRRGE